MAVNLELFNLIIRRDRIEALLPGGWSQFCAEYGAPLPFRADDDLVCFGSPGGAGIEKLGEHLTNRGMVLGTSRQHRGSGADMVLHGAGDGSGIAGCDWLAITDENKACFTGTREKTVRPQIHSSWSDSLVRLSVEYIDMLLATSPDRRAPLPLKNWDNDFALLKIDMEARACLVAVDRTTSARYAFPLIEDLLNAGWAVD